MFCNFLLADEINRAPAKVQSALLEVMQEHQVTIGGNDAIAVPPPFIVMATQNPIESEGTYPLPEAQLDRFLMKILVDYPSTGEEAAVVGRSLGAAGRRAGACCRSTISAATRRRRERCSSTARRSVTRSRSRTRPVIRQSTGWPTSLRLIEFGASPRGPIGLVQAARVLALLRGRGHVVRRRHPRPGGGRAAPPDRAVLRRAQRRRDRRPVARARAGRCTASPTPSDLIQESPTAVRAR